MTQSDSSDFNSKGHSTCLIQKKAGSGPATQFPTHATASKTAADFLKARLDCAAFFTQLFYTSLPFVSTAGRGAVPSGTAPAFSGGSALVSAPIPVPIS